MGEKHKLLLHWDGETIIKKVIRNVKASLLGEPILIYSEEKILREVESTGIRAVLNPTASEGMSSTIKTGLRLIEDNADGVIFVFGDMPLVSSKILNRLADTFERLEDRRERIVCPYVQGHRRLPNIYGRYFFPLIQGITGDIGPRNILKANIDRVVRVEFEDETPFLDVDSPEDYRRIQTLR